MIRKISTVLALLVFTLIGFPSTSVVVAEENEIHVGEVTERHCVSMICLEESEYSEEYSALLCDFASGNLDAFATILEVAKQEFGYEGHLNTLSICVGVELSEAIAETMENYQNVPKEVDNDLIEEVDIDRIIEETCDHPFIYHSTAIIRIRKLGGPNSVYCEWGDAQAVTMCTACWEVLTYLSPTTYYDFHTWVVVPPNIQYCSRCYYYT